MPDPAEAMKNGASPPAFSLPAGGAATVSAVASPMEASTVAGFPYKSSETPKSYPRKSFSLPLDLNSFDHRSCTVHVSILLSCFFFLGGVDLVSGGGVGIFYSS